MYRNKNSYTNVPPSQRFRSYKCHYTKSFMHISSYVPVVGISVYVLLYCVVRLYSVALSFFFLY
jgi:hypothetical protein